MPVKKKKFLHFKELNSWQKAVELSELTTRQVAVFSEEGSSLARQLQVTAISIPA